MLKIVNWLYMITYYSTLCLHMIHFTQHLNVLLNVTLCMNSGVLEQYFKDKYLDILLYISCIIINEYIRNIIFPNNYSLSFFTYILFMSSGWWFGKQWNSPSHWYIWSDIIIWLNSDNLYMNLVAYFNKRAVFSPLKMYVNNYSYYWHCCFYFDPHGRYIYPEKGVIIFIRDDIIMTQYLILLIPFINILKICVINPVTFETTILA